MMMIDVPKALTVDQQFLGLPEAALYVWLCLASVGKWFCALLGIFFVILGLTMGLLKQIQGGDLVSDHFESL